jgi:CO/xanthine dehydrogenase Mo-binding subunit
MIHWYKTKPIDIRVCILLYCGAFLLLAMNVAADILGVPNPQVDVQSALAMVVIGFCTGVGAAYRVHNRAWSAALDEAERAGRTLDDLVSRMLGGNTRFRIRWDADGRVIEIADDLPEDPPITLQ